MLQSLLVFCIDKYRQIRQVQLQIPGDIQVWYITNSIIIFSRTLAKIYQLSCSHLFNIFVINSEVT